MVGVISAVLTGSTAGLAVASSSLTAALSCGVVLGLVVLTALMRHQRSAWDRAIQTPLFESRDPGSHEDAHDAPGGRQRRE